MTGEILLIVAGGLGAGSRLLAGSAIQSRLRSELPWGTAAVNTLGAFALGVVAGSEVAGVAFDVAAGFIAGFTTFSTWMIETVHLWIEGSGGRRRAAVNLVGVLVAALAAAAVGVSLGGRLT
jgi:CrcB protein